MKVIRSFFLGWFFVFVSSSIQANDLSVGGLLGFSSDFMDYKNGDTIPENSSTLGIIGFYKASRFSRFSFSMEKMDDTHFTPKSNSVGLMANRQMLSVSYDYQLVISELIKPYLGAGLIYSNNEFNNRFRVDEEGFLLQGLPNKKSNDISGQLLVTQQWNIAQYLGFGLRARYELANKPFTSASFSAFAVYLF